MQQGRVPCPDRELIVTGLRLHGRPRPQLTLPLMRLLGGGGGTFALLVTLHVPVQGRLTTKDLRAHNARVMPGGS